MTRLVWIGYTPWLDQSELGYTALTQSVWIRLYHFDSISVNWLYRLDTMSELVIPLKLDQSELGYTALTRSVWID